MANWANYPDLAGKLGKFRKKLKWSVRLRHFNCIDFSVERKLQK